MSNQAPSTSTMELILTEVREMRKELTEFRSEMQQRVSVLETQMHPLIDNGQPGLITQLGARLTKLEHWRAYLLGISAAVSTAIAYLLKVLNLA